VNPCIGPARTCNSNWFPQQGGEGLLHYPLDRPLVRLDLPTEKSGAVIGHMQEISGHLPSKITHLLTFFNPKSFSYGAIRGYFCAPLEGLNIKR
jgi:hypothetical protein